MNFLLNHAGDVAKIAYTWDHTMNENAGLWLHRSDIRDIDHADQLAEAATAITGKLHIGIDNGPCVYPRYDVIEAPMLGEKVSYAFNGDYYPCGVITKISKSLRRIETDTGRVFFRKRLTGRWLSDGMWTMVSGHISEKNPEF